MKFFPRLGMVWDPKGDGKMTVRAAYGLFGDRYHMFGLNFIGQEPPFGNNVVLPSVNIANPWANYPGGNPFPDFHDQDVGLPDGGRVSRNARVRPDPSVLPFGFQLAPICPRRPWSAILRITLPMVAFQLTQTGFSRLA